MRVHEPLSVADVIDTASRLHSWSNTLRFPWAAPETGEPLSVADVIDTASRLHSWNLHEAMKTISEAGSGVLVLLHRTEDGDQLLAHLDDKPQAPPKVDLRNYGIGAQILRDVGVTRMRLLAAPRRMPSMAGFDLEITGYMQPGR